MSTLAERTRKLMEKNPILEGRNKIDSETVVRMFGKSFFTPKEVARVDIIDRKTGEPKHYYYVAIREDDTVIISSGHVLTNMLDGIISEVGSIEDFNKELETDDTFRLVPAMIRGKSGNRYMDVDLAL